jgi:RNA polymerase sigma factor (sigma-70 family)
MPATTLPGFLQRLKQVMAAEALGTIPDRELLGRFLSTQDDAAFRALIGRHGPMVFRVCRRVLRRDQDAEDAFQASFLVLARQGHTIRKRTSLASWLHGVAYRTALEAREGFARRRKHETRASLATRPALPDETTWKELRAVLDEELGRLPERLRSPLVLCYLEGLTQDEAADRLGQSKATCRRNLERGREVLAARLSRRGVTLSAALFAPLLADATASAPMPPGLVGSTVEAAARAAVGKAVAGAVPAKVAALMEGVMRAMFFTKVKGVGAILLAVALLGGAITAGAFQDPKQERRAEKGPGAPPPPAKPAVDPKGAVDPRVARILEDALGDADGIENAFNRTVAFCYVARAHARAGRREAAAAVLRKALDAEALSDPQHKDNRLWIIAECQAETGDVKGALETVEGGVSEGNHSSALRYVAPAQARAGDVKGALETVERMKAGDGDSYKGEALRQIAVIRAEAGDVKGALETAGLIRGDMANRALALAAVVAARVKAGDREGAAKLVGRVRENIPENGPPRDFALTALAAAQAALGKAEEAVRTTKDIEEAQWRDWALVRIATGQAARGDAKGARQTAEVIEDAYPKGEALKEVVAALIRAKDLPAAAKAAGDIGHDIGRCYALMEVAKARAGAGQKAEAAEALREAMALADRLENPPQTGGVREAALAHCAGARAAAGDPDGALEWAGKQEDRWVRAMARIRVAEALAGKGRK